MAIGAGLGALFGLGLWLIWASMPWAQRRPSLAERFSLLTARGRLEHDQMNAPAARLFKSSATERLLRPIIEDLGRLIARLMARLGIGTADLERRLALGWPGMDMPHFYGQKVSTGVVLLLFFPLMNVAGIHPFGTWPIWFWLGGFIAGFVLPDWMLDGRLQRRRQAVMAELPVMLDVMAIAASAGLSPEQTLLETSRHMRGTLGDGLREVVREAGLGATTYDEGLKHLAQREQVPELVSLADVWQASLHQGLPLSQAMLTLSTAARERMRARLLEEAGKASVKMLFPVAVFIFPIILVVLLYPASVELLGLGG